MAFYKGNNMKEIKQEDIEKFLNLDTETDSLKKIDEQLGRDFDFPKVVKAHREELSMLEEINGYLRIINADYDPKLHARQAVEMAYLVKIDLLYHLARRFHPFTTYGRGLLKQAEECRKEFEAKVGPLVTGITAKNVYDYHELLPLRFAEEIWTGRSQGIGIFRSDMNKLFVAGALVYEWTIQPDTGDKMINIRWLKVHERFLRQGVCQELVGELLSMATRRGAKVVSVDIPITDDMTVFGNFFTEWHFEFTPMATPEYVCFLRDIQRKKELLRSDYAAVPLIDIDKNLRHATLKTFFEEVKEKKASVYLSMPEGYYDPEISCVYMHENKVSGVLLAHKYRGKRLLVEYVTTEEKTEGQLETLLLFCAKCTIEKYDRHTELVVKADSIELREACEKLFPDQRARLYVEGILTEPGEDDLEDEMISELLSAGEEELLDRTE